MATAVAKASSEVGIRIVCINLYHDRSFSIRPNLLTFHTSNSLVFAGKFKERENVFYLDPSQLVEYFDAGALNVGELSMALCDGIIPRNKLRIEGKKVGPLERAHQYRSLIENGVVKNQSELAAYIEVSRAWVSKTMSIMEKDHG